MIQRRSRLVLVVKHVARVPWRDFLRADACGRRSALDGAGAFMLNNTWRDCDLCEIMKITGRKVPVTLRFLPGFTGRTPVTFRFLPGRLSRDASLVVTFMFKTNLGLFIALRLNNPGTKRRLVQKSTHDSS